ncbi:MAG: hypothetical protein KAQ69_13055 [Spirochaetales bacterium]|nr:hypothetical protein [Spirochaetales bacterium]
MKTFLIICGIIVAAAVIIACIFLARYYRKKRTEELKAAAASQKLSFSEKPDDTFLPSLSQFHLFSKGHSKKVSNVMNGRVNETDISIFDYRYITGSGKNSHTWRQTVILFQSSQQQLPSFVLRPENVFHKIGSTFGYKDINFDSHPTFSKQYLLRGTDEKAIRKTFRNKVLAYFDEHNKLSTEGDGDKLLFYRHSKRVSPQNVKIFQEEGFRVLKLFKVF